MIDGILQQTANDMKKQCNEVNVAFGKRIAETKDTKSKLEDHLNKVTYGPVILIYRPERTVWSAPKIWRILLHFSQYSI